MANFQLKEIKTANDEKAFLEMPVELYKYDSNWVRPLNNDIKAVFNPSKNLLFNGGEAIRWILIDEKDNVVGRIAAFYNVEQLAMGYCKAGGCGFFECIDSQVAANILFDASIKWLESRGIQAVDGSINFGDREQFWGVLVDGFHHPMYGANYNRPYYGRLFEQYGFQVYFNQYSYIAGFDATTLYPSILEKSRRLNENQQFEFRAICKSELATAPEMLRSIYNLAWANFSDAKEMSIKQAEGLIKMLKSILDLNIVIFAFFEDKPIGFFISIPDINLAIKGLNGNLRFFNLLRFLYRFKIKKVCNIAQGILFGVVPEFQGKGVESAMIMQFFKNTAKKRQYKHIEIMWIGDFNPLMIRMVENHVCAKKYKHLITYRYIIDKNIEFKRAENVSITRKSKK